MKHDNQNNEIDHTNIPAFTESLRDPPRRALWIGLSIGITFIVAALAPTLEDGNSNRAVGLAEPLIDWADRGGSLTKSAYLLVVITLLAAVIERIVEVVVSMARTRKRDVYEINVEHAERQWKTSRKDEDFLRALCDAQLQLSSFRSETRMQTVTISLSLGAIIAALIDLPLMETLIGDQRGNTALATIAEVWIIGLLVAGGADPLHKLISDFQKGVNSLARIGKKGIA